MISLSSRDSAQRLVESFARNGGKYLNEIREAAGSRDLEALHKAAHAFKGMSLTLGGGDVGDACQRLQAITEITTPELSEQIDALQAAFAQTVRALREYLGLQTEVAAT